jgi:hexosaminidase
MRSSLLAVICAVGLSMGVGSVLSAEPERPLNLIPLPASVTPGEGQVVLKSDTPIVADKDRQKMAARFVKLLEPIYGDATAPAEPKPNQAAIRVTIDPSLKTLGDEGYRLETSPREIAITAAAEAGVFYAGQTLRQLLPVDAFKTGKVDGVAWSVPALRIEDRPRFRWRGLMLDCSRHFFTKQEILKFIDELAMHKFNVFHWHLTDDQGWRIEIKKYPKLTEVGAWRDGVGFNLDPKSSTAYDASGRYGGFYSQEDVKQIVAYAAERHITIVPEIELPGHCLASLAAYPENSCNDGPFRIRLTGGVEREVYCAGKDATFEFIEGLLGEAVELFPGEFIHIGGDECPKDRWKQCAKCQARIKAEGLKDERELQSYFIRRVEKFLNSKGKRLIGWDEILEGGLAPNATVMSWQGIAGGLAAAKSGHDAVMSPNSHCYFDQLQARTGEPRGQGGFIPLEKVFAFNPIPPELQGEQAGRILGAQGNLWTEYMPNFAHVEYMAWPRGCALAEVIWSGPGRSDYAGFVSRLEPHLERLKAAGVNFRALDNYGAQSKSKNTRQ